MELQKRSLKKRIDGIQLFRQHLAHSQVSFSCDCFISILCTLRVTRFFRQYLAHTKDYSSFGCFVSILRTYRITFHSIVSLLSHTLLGLNFIQLFRQYLAYTQDCFVNIQREPRITFHFIVLLISCAHQVYISFALFHSILRLLTTTFHTIFFDTQSRSVRILFVSIESFSFSFHSLVTRTL